MIVVDPRAQAEMPITTLRGGPRCGMAAGCQPSSGRPHRAWPGLASACALAAGLLAGPLPCASASEISEQEFTCLALNIYHEARNQPIEGQLAVAHVTLNRTEAGAPTSICEVVYRDWAFSWTRDPRKQRPPAEPQAWAVAQAVARWALADRDSDPVAGSTFFHAVTVEPDWAPAMVRVRRIGDHVFYRSEATASANGSRRELSESP